MSDTLGRRRLLLIAFLIFFATYLGFALAGNILTIALLFSLYGAFQGIFRAAGKALATDLVPERMRASGLGFYSATIGVQGLVASVVAGLLWDRVGHAAVFWYGAIFAAVGSIALLVLLPADAKRA